MKLIIRLITFQKLTSLVEITKKVLLHTHNAIDGMYVTVTTNFCVSQYTMSLILHGSTIM